MKHTTAGELLEVMQTRLEMQTDGIANPSDSIKAVTRTLVEKLSALDPKERIEIVAIEPSSGKYIRLATGEVLAEIKEEESTEREH